MCSPKLFLCTAILMLSVSSFLSKGYATKEEGCISHQLGEPAKEEDSFSKDDEPQMVHIKLRSSHKTLNSDEVKAMIKEYNFFSIDSNNGGNFENDFERMRVNGFKVVIDHATGLMWHKSGSFKFLSWNDAKVWIEALNQRGYAGYSDWRLPTTEEAASLLESRKRYGGLYIDPIFDRRQPYIWTGDTKEGSGVSIALSIYFDDAKIRWDETNSFNRNFVRPVRTNR